jgi:hypothetical protein
VLQSGGCRRRRTAAAAAAASCLSVALLAATAASSAPAASSRSPWQPFGRTKVDGTSAVLALPTWAANRVWVDVYLGDGGLLASAHLSAGRLGSFAQLRVPTYTGRPDPIVDGQVVIEKAATTKSNDYVLTDVTAPLLANGRLGAPRDVPDDLLARAKEAVPKLWSAGILAGVRAGRRVVWALGGAPDCHSIGGCPGFFLACCSESGAAVNLTRFIDPRENLLGQLGFLHIGRDTRGRIWLAWLDNSDFRHSAAGYPRMLELDGSSLAPRSDAHAVPGIVATRLALACADSCRVVADTNPPLSPGRIVSWAPGERSPTVIVTAWHNKVVRSGGAELLAATYRSGHLVVGYDGEMGKTQYADESIRHKIWVVRGDARGARAQVVGEIPFADYWPPENPSSPVELGIAHGTFVPGGLFVVESFRDAPGLSPIVGAFVPLGR